MERKHAQFYILEKIILKLLRRGRTLTITITTINNNNKAGTIIRYFYVGGTILSPSLIVVVDVILCTNKTLMG